MASYIPAFSEGLPIQIGNWRCLFTSLVLVPGGRDNKDWMEWNCSFPPTTWN